MDAKLVEELSGQKYNADACKFIGFCFVLLSIMLIISDGTMYDANIAQLTAGQCAFDASVSPWSLLLYRPEVNCVHNQQQVL